MHRFVRPIALLCTGWLAACSKEAPKTDSAAVSQSGGTAAHGATYDPGTRVATAIANDFAFLAPDTVLAGWTTFRLINDGQTIHHMQIVRLDGGKTPSDLLAAMKTPGPLPSWAATVGGPNVPDPKSESNVTLNLPAGQYVLLCFVDTPDKVPHFAKGMVRPLTVAASSATGTEPVADVTVSLTDYAFTVTAGMLSPGKHTVKVVNDGPQEHEIQLVRFAPGKSMKDFAAWLTKMDSPPPAAGLGGVAGNVKGGTGYFTVDLSPGDYAFICFAPDVKDGKTHLDHGMLKEFKVE